VGTDCTNLARTESAGMRWRCLNMTVEYSENLRIILI
jgi:hypothetical protein